MTALQRHPIAVGAGVTALMVVLTVLAAAVPMSPNAKHAAGHLAVGIPLLILLGLVRTAWSDPGSGVPAGLARDTLVWGLWAAGVGLVVEAIGAFGYAEDGSPTGLAILHDLSALVWPIGFVLILVGALVGRSFPGGTPPRRALGRRTLWPC